MNRNKGTQLTPIATPATTTATRHGHWLYRRKEDINEMKVHLYCFALTKLECIITIGYNTYKNII